MTVEETAAPVPHAAPRPSGRRDHERNRHRIITAARELFASKNASDVQLKDVAQTAGVSQATLFRHIGSKQSLLTMAYQDRISEIIDAADAALAEDDPWTAVCTLVRTLAGWFHEDRGLFEFAASADVAADPQHATMVARLEQVLARARADGSLQVHIGAADLVPLLAVAARQDCDRWDDYTDVLLGGLRQPYARPC
ncbi:TetR/AcrR family transcriptional regulator [Goekera deserti]|uniref:TetR/AcrR family transcriptional regulator n=1 Tax=Goekera deserti TaxID=2497753 RepID=A0A7K3WHP0_9ACTN|nr:TetR/AcrR family transcriptional regulator [Goekera deserti]NDI47352.1 TetR family transcriptional regulator [Goekera deserti]NEL55882.1 TetR/AcrR family transcriptional regulator [Goekera deserti]